MADHSHRPFSHVDDEGRARMIDVGEKETTHRTAVAISRVAMAAATADLIREGKAEKGNVFQAARLAGIMAAKKTSDLIPLCHPLPLTHASVEFEWEDGTHLLIRATTKTDAKTGVEMEALTAAAVAALTVYDMCKAVDRGMTIQTVQLFEKTGGKSGTFRRA
jgi:cyclic pyranopterin phosphate synthase